MYRKFIKRLLDLIAGLIGLAIALPFIVVVAILLLFANRGKVLFIQKRPGYKSKPIYVVKFRTMNDRRDTDGNLLPDDKRLTKVGKAVRKFSFDELPQLYNVLKGDLSIIGPRPLLMEYLPLYNEEQARRHDVKPGITGWAQVNGRNSISWEDKFKYDVHYVDHVSFGLDFKILLMTFKKVFVQEGISEEGGATMKKFTGTKTD